MNEKSFSLEVDYRYFKKKILETTGIALDAYKPRQMQRRIKELSERKGFYTLKKFWSFLEKNPEEYRKFLDYITINFSEFFRDVDRFNELERKIIPDLLTRTPNLRIWSAACATGEEPYSVAIILEKSYPEVTTRILATDIDEGALEKAKMGIYDKTHVKNVPPVILDRYFIRKGESFIVKENIKRRVKFKKINLLEDNFPREFFWLILCRNMIIYLEDEVKDTLLVKLYSSLRKGGVLFLGGTEKILAPEKFGFKLIGNCFYQKI